MLVKNNHKLELCCQNIEDIFHEKLIEIKQYISTELNSEIYSAFNSLNKGLNCMRKY